MFRFARIVYLPLILGVYGHAQTHAEEEREAWRTINDHGNRLREEGRCRESVPLLLRARSIAAKDLGPRDEAIAIATNNLGAAYLCLGQYTRADQAFREALQLLNPQRLSETKVAVANNLGVLLLRLAKWKEAGEVLQEGLRLAESAYGPAHPGTATAVHSLGVLQLRVGEYQRARSLFVRAVAIWESSLGDHLHTATALNNLGVAQLYLKEYKEALPHTARALELRRKVLPPHHPDVAVSLHNHAVALEKTGDKRSSQAAFREARSIRAAFASENLLGITVDRKVLEKQ